MKGFWDFAIEAPLPAVALVLLGIYIPCRYAWKFWVTHNRHKNIKAQGWPPPYLDADGDMQAANVEQETEETTN